MKGTGNKYRLAQKISAGFMILALLWLTISTPFVFRSQQEKAKAEKAGFACSPVDSEEESTNPFSNTTEEKAPDNGTTFSEEYLHDHHTADELFFIASQFHKCENAGTYIAYHGELLVPPPNFS